MRRIPTDIRTTATFVEQILGGFDELSRNHKRFTMDPLKFERHMEYVHRDAEQTERAKIKKRVSQAFKRLVKSECITEQKGDYALTLKGWFRYLEHYAHGVRRAKKKHKKSKKVFVVIFDVPEELRRFRDTLRRVLRNLDFEPLQQSVFLTRNAQHFEKLSRIIAQTELVDRVKMNVGDQIL